MGHKTVCFNCRKAFSMGADLTRPAHKSCPECQGEVFIYPHRFRPPQKNDLKKWEVIEFLKQNGLFYHHIYDKYEFIDQEGNQKECSGCAKYPETMREAKDFVGKYGALNNVINAN